MILARAGHDVHGVDISKDIVSMLNKGKIHITEPGLENAFQMVLSHGRFRASLKPSEADIFIISVPTPFTFEGEVPTPDLSYVMAAVKSITPYIKPGNYIILESTSPVGSTENLAEELAQNDIDISTVHIAYCPERVIPGRAMIELVENDRIVGGLTEEATRNISDFYRTIVKGAILTTDSRTAEMTKLAENSFRDVNIAFANELSILAANAGVDVNKLIALANRHPRVHILQPGPGVGGHCIAVDPWFLVAGDVENSRLIATARKVNDSKTEWVIEQIEASIADLAVSLGRPPHVTLLGLTFKPDIDDLRESPAVKIAETLHTKKYNIHCVEPHITRHDTLPLISLEKGLKTSDIVVALVKHSMFDLGGIEQRISPVKLLNFVGL